jgi:hypothetical protein
VSIDCHSGDMRANILTSTLFDGKIYAKGSPETCMEDINGQVPILYRKLPFRQKKVSV